MGAPSMSIWERTHLSVFDKFPDDTTENPVEGLLTGCPRFMEAPEAVVKLQVSLQSVLKVVGAQCPHTAREGVIGHVQLPVGQ